MFDGAVNGRPSTSPAPPAQFRIVLVSFLSAAIGLIAGLVAYALYKLIGFFTNLFFFHRLSTDFVSLRAVHNWWVILIPVVGGLIVGVMAKYGTSKIKGHGIPEAMEAVLVNRSRIEPKVALLKPISAAIAIGTADHLARKDRSFRRVGLWDRSWGRYYTRRRSREKSCWHAVPQRVCRQPSTLPSRV